MASTPTAAARTTTTRTPTASSATSTSARAPTRCPWKANFRAATAKMTLPWGGSNPARVEILSDDVDQDCDSLTGAAGYNTFRLDPMADFVDFDDTDATLFIGVHTMVFGENAAQVHFGVGADGNDIVADAGVIEMFSFGDGDPLGGFSSGTDLITGSSAGTTPFDLSPTTAFWVDDDVSLSLTGAVFPTLRTLYLRGRDEVTGSDLSHAAGPTLPSGLSEWIPMTDVSLLRDTAGDFHGIGCDPITEVMQYVYDTPAALGLGTSDIGETSFARHRYTEKSSRRSAHPSASSSSETAKYSCSRTMTAPSVPMESMTAATTWSAARDDDGAASVRR